MIFSAYRRDDFADPDMFVLQVGMVLERYSDEVIRKVSHPHTGVQRHREQPPSIAHIVAACDAEVHSIATSERLRAMGTARLGTRLLTYEPQRHLANVLVHVGAPQYAEMCDRARSEPNTRLWRHDPEGRGIWVVWSWFDERQGRTKMRRFTAADLRNLPEAPAA